MVGYDPHQWMDHFLDIRGSMVREIMGRVGATVLWAAVVVAVDTWVRPVGVVSNVHSLVGGALGLLLVFRTNSSYDRFWEGRKLWGGIVNETRNLVRMSAAMIEDQGAVREIARWTAAFPYATMNHLRGGSDLGNAATRLDPAEVSAAVAAQHTPLAIVARVSDVLREQRAAGRLSDITLVALEQNLTLLVDYLGACERIRNTPAPFAYVVHLRRALVAYCVSLPFAIVDTSGWRTILDVFFIAYVFFGIEEIGVEIEDPFGQDENDLPLDQICANLERTLLALVPGA